ncbi:MAG: ABC transporter permease [Muribaculaceae bacterium]|nr:ABC transporter permease [Muribaculaceae bacterium]
MILAIFDTDNWREIGATLARNKTRTFLTAFGIFWGTAMLAMLHGGALGLAGFMARNFEGFATNMGAVIPSTTSMPYKGFNKGMWWSITVEDIDRAKRMSTKMDLVSPLISRGGTAAYGTKSTSANMNGCGPDFWKIQQVNVHAGRVLNEGDERQNAKVAVIGRNVSDELFGPDPQQALGKYVNVNGLYYKCVGVASQKGEATIQGRVDNAVYVPLGPMRTAFNMGNKVDFFVFTAKDGYKPKDVLPSIRRAICAGHPIHPDDEKAFWMMDVSEMFDVVNTMFTGIDLLALLVGAGTLIAGIIGVGNIMWIIVRERTREIGIRRAIGAKPRDIIVQILSESMVLTTIAGTAGICFACAVLHGADALTAVPGHAAAGFQLGFGTAVAILAVFLVLGTAAGLIPSIKAMKIKPVEAMKDK